MKDWDATQDVFGDELDWFDDHPEDDPFLPKPSCPWCDGTGEKENRDGDTYECPDCEGSGVQNGS
jgi:hypothetical protein